MSAGITDVNDAMMISRIAAKTAEAGLADMQVTTEALVAAMLSYGAGADEAARYSDILTRTVQVGVGTMNEFGNSLAYVLPSAAGLNVSFQEVGANMAYLTQRGFGASTAATSLNNAFSTLLKPSEGLAAIYEELGVSSGPELISTFNGLEGALTAINNAIDGDIVKLREIFPDARGFRAVSAMLNNADDWAATLDEFNGAIDGATDSAQQQQMMSFNAQMDLMRAAVEGLAITIGNALIPVLMPIIQGIRDFAAALADTSPEVIQVAVVVAGLAAALGPALWILGSLLNPIALVIAALGGLAYAFATDMNGIRTSVMGMIDSVLPGFDLFLRRLQDGFNFEFNAQNLADELAAIPAMIGPELPPIGVIQPVTFTIEPGDTPGEIANELGITIEELLAATNSSSIYELNVGTFTIDGTVDTSPIGERFGNITGTIATMYIQNAQMKDQQAAIDAANQGIVDIIQTSLMDKIMFAAKGTPFEGVLDGIIVALNDLKTAVQPVVDAVSGSVKTAFDIITDALTRFGNETDLTVIQDIAGALGNLAGLFLVFAGTLLVGAAEGLGGALDALSNFLNNMKAMFTDLQNGASIGTLVSDMLTTIRDAIVDLAAIPVIAIAGVIDEIARLAGLDTNFADAMKMFMDTLKVISSTLLPNIGADINRYIVIPMWKAMLEIQKATDNLLNGGTASVQQLALQVSLQAAVDWTNVQDVSSKLIYELQNAVNSRTAVISPTFEITNLDGSVTTIDLATAVDLGLASPEAIDIAKTQIMDMLASAATNGDAGAFQAALDVAAELNMDLAPITAQYAEFMQAAAIAPFDVAATVDVTVSAGVVDTSNLRMSIANAIIDAAAQGSSGETANALGLSHNAPQNPVGGHTPGRASGGSVSAGQNYFWNERGGEMFMPGENGMVLPTRLLRDMMRGSGGSKSSGGGNNISITTNDPDKMIYELKRRGIDLYRLAKGR